MINSRFDKLQKLKRKSSFHLDLSAIKGPKTATHLNQKKISFNNSPPKSFLDSKSQFVKPLKESNKSSISSANLRGLLSSFREKSKSPLNVQGCLSQRPVFPITPDEALMYDLNSKELQEIFDYQKIYYVGQNRKSNMNHLLNEKGEFVCSLNDHIAYQYEIFDILGTGSFGQVFKVYDHKNRRILALKMIRNQDKLKKQAGVEARLLHHIKLQDTQKTSNIVEIVDSFQYRGHQCIAFELLDINLYELLKFKGFKGLSIDLIRKIAIQILNSLNFLNKQSIIHCDLKPENIMLVDRTKSGIKLVDFGSGCFDGEQIYTYIQSRYYRAPEVIFGLEYSYEIDIWSFACILAELHLGHPLFPGSNEEEQIQLIMESIGPPSSQFVKKCPRRDYFFDEIGQPLSSKRFRQNGLKQKLKLEDGAFLDFFIQCFQWEPENRITPLEALTHKWIIQGLPQEIKASHQKYIMHEKIHQRKASQDKSLTPKNSSLIKFKHMLQINLVIYLLNNFINIVEFTKCEREQGAQKYFGCLTIELQIF